MGRPNRSFQLFPVPSIDNGPSGIATVFVAYYSVSADRFWDKSNNTFDLTTDGSARPVDPPSLGSNYWVQATTNTANPVTWYTTAFSTPKLNFNRALSSPRRREGYRFQCRSPSLPLRFGYKPHRFQLHAAGSNVCHSKAGWKQPAFPGHIGDGFRDREPTPPPPGSKCG